MYVQGAKSKFAHSDLPVADIELKYIAAPKRDACENSDATRLCV